MPVSKGKTPKVKRPPPRQPLPREVIQLKHLKGLWERIRDHPVPWSLSVVAALIGIGTFAWQVLNEPEINVSSSGENLPFLVPITVTNKSFLFSMYSARVSCYVKRATFDSGGEIERSRFVPIGAITIKPEQTANFQCPVTNLPSSRLSSGEMTAQVIYKTLWWWARTSEETEITWFISSIPPRWIRGGFARPPASM